MVKIGVCMTTRSVQHAASFIIADTPHARRLSCTPGRVHGRKMSAQVDSVLWLAQACLPPDKQGTAWASGFAFPWGCAILGYRKKNRHRGFRTAGGNGQGQWERPGGYTPTSGPVGASPLVGLLRIINQSAALIGRSARQVGPTEENAGHPGTAQLTHAGERTR